MSKDRLSSLPPEILKQLEEMSNPKPPVAIIKPKRIGNKPDIALDGEGNPVTTCMCCHQNKIRMGSNKRTKAGAVMYYDDKGRRWRGKNCPECSYKKHLNYIRKIRGTKNPRV